MHTLCGVHMLCSPSGDGTVRKNPTIWRSWNPALGAALHKLGQHAPYMYLHVHVHSAVEWSNEVATMFVIACVVKVLYSCSVIYMYSAADGPGIV